MNILKFFILLFTITIFVSCAKEINIDEELEEPITFEEPSYIQTVDILFTGSSTVSVMDTAVSDMLSMYREIFLQVKEVKLLAAIIADTFV